MIRLSRNDQPERVRPIEVRFVPREVVVTTVKSARNDAHPHYLNVAAGASASPNFDEPLIDGILQRLGAGACSVARVFVPRSSVEALRNAPAALSSTPNIPSDYEASEDTGGLSRTYRVGFEHDINVLRVCAELTRSKAVETVTPNYTYEAKVRPNDEFYGFQWGPPAIACEDAWDLEYGHADVRIAIVDSGVDLDHQDLQAKLVGGRDFVDLTQGAFGPRYELIGDYQTRDLTPDDEDGHGTHCAGIATAASDNASGIAGVCWGGSILPVRVMCRVYDRWTDNVTSVGSSVDIAAGIKFAVDAGAHVVNLSLGGSQPSYTNVLDYAHDNNVCLIAATGNENTSQASYPAANPKVLAVGAIDQNLNRASFSNYGPNYNAFVMAPGVRIASTYVDNGYVYLDGTSMATPFVSGLVGLIVSVALRANRTLAVDDIYEIIRKTANDIGPQHFYGSGLVNAAAALDEAQKRLTCADDSGSGPAKKKSKKRQK